VTIDDLFVHQTLVGVALLLGACSFDPAPATPPPDPRVCSLGWQTLFTADQNLLPPFTLAGETSVAVAGDRVLFNGVGLPPEPSGIRSVSTAGGPASLVFRGYPSTFWVEDG